MNNINAKYIIVGQGLAGTLLSFQLFKRQIPHIVVGNRQLGTSSEVAAGMFNPLVFKRITKSWMIDELLPVMKSCYQELESELGNKFIHDIPVAKLIAPEEKSWWQDRVNSQQLEDYFDGFKPSGHIGGIKENYEIARVRNAGFVDLPFMLKSYRARLKEKEMFYDTSFNYNDLEIEKGLVSWKGIEAEGIVFCQGSSAINNPFFSSVKYYLTKGEVLDVKIKGLSEDYIINKDVFLLPLGDHRFRLGSTYNHTDLEWSPTKDGADNLITKAEQLIDCKIEIIDHRAGVRPTISDRRPVLGRHPEYQNVFIFNGLGTKGVMLAPYFSLEMLHLMENNEYEVNREVSLDRFLKKSL